MLHPSEATVAQLLVRNLDEAIVRALKQRAARNGRSAEAEHREILREALLQSGAPTRSLKEVLLEPPIELTEDDMDVFERVREYPRDIDLS